jgi:hypothetical protein
LDDLFSVRHQLGPEKYASNLRTFDVTHGIDKLWDRDVPDPWASTFGLQKVAEVVWEDGVDRVTAQQLHNVAMNHTGHLDEVFTEGFVKEFYKDPIGVFNSLPLPQKRRFARLADDLAHQGGSEGQIPLTAGKDPVPKKKEGALSPEMQRAAQLVRAGQQGA